MGDHEPDPGPELPLAKTASIALCRVCGEKLIRTASGNWKHFGVGVPYEKVEIGSGPCPHLNWRAQVDVTGITEVEEGPAVCYYADVKVWCEACDEPMVFRGAPIGVGPDRPHLSADGTELRAPCVPKSWDPRSGLGLAGVRMRIEEGEGQRNN